MSEPNAATEVEESDDRAPPVLPVPLVDFGQLDDNPAAERDRVTEVDVQIVLGSTVLQAGAVEQLDCGSVVALDQSAEAPASVYVDGRLVARGELVAVDHHYAVRITELADDLGLDEVGRAMDSP